MPHDGAERQEREPRVEDHLTPERAARLVFYSFRFSQGDDVTQRLILAWLHERYHWHLSKKDQKESRVQLEKMTDKFKDQQFGVSHFGLKEETYESVIEELPDYLAILGGSTELVEAAEKLLRRPEENTRAGQLLATFASNDRFHIAGRRAIAGGRAGSARYDSGSGNIKDDSYFSFLCTYILQEHSTHIPEFDELFEDVRQHLKTETLSQDSLRDIEAVVGVYNEHHPGNPVAWEPPRIKD